MHPLDPLSSQELEEVVKHSRKAWDLKEQHLFAMVQLNEPDKESLINNKPVERSAKVTILDTATALVYEGIITIEGTSLSWKEIENAKSPVLSTESRKAIRAVLENPEVIEALKERGIKQPQTQVHIETWPIGAQIPEFLNDGRRLIWTPMWFKPNKDSNMYAHPINGLYAIVDLKTYEVVSIENSEKTPIPETPGDYRLSQTGGDVKLNSLEIIQKDGPSFKLDGWKLTWERWNLRIGFDQREGLVIPYGDPSQGTYRKNAFDTGEYGLGNYTNSLLLGCDCLGEIVYLDISLVEPEGNVRTIKNAICLHEEDFGILWKHVDTDGHVEVRRSRRMVISSIVTINNYEYGYYWYFYQDGSIEFEAKLTGIVLTIADTPGKKHPSATEIEKGLWAPYHQHTFCARLDLDIDGNQNTVLEVNSVSKPMGPENVHGAAYITEEKVFEKESEATSLISIEKSRYWKIINENKKNHLNKPVGYKLIHNTNTLPLASKDSVIGQRAGFMYKHLWVTKNDPNQKYPAGDYPFQSKKDEGLPTYIKQNRDLKNTDVVLWYVFGLNHIPRTEDWPVMPVERLGFTLKPVNFFRRSPAMDVAPNEAKCHCGSSCNCQH
jgi:primary-amine oxidase